MIFLLINKGCVESENIKWWTEELRSYTSVKAVQLQK